MHLLVILTDPSQLSVEHFTEAIRWIAGAVIALAAFVGVIVRWMMVRIDTTQKSLEKAVDSFAESIELWRAHTAEEKETSVTLAASQREILQELRLLHRHHFVSEHKE